MHGRVVGVGLACRKEGVGLHERNRATSYPSCLIPVRTKEPKKCKSKDIVRIAFGGFKSVLFLL